MLSKINLFLRYESEENCDYNISSSMQGALMEMIPTSYAEELHKNQIHPYSQHIRKLNEGLNDFAKGSKMVWTIAALNDDAERNIIDVLNANPPQQITLRHNNITFKTNNVTGFSRTYEDLMENYYFHDQERAIQIRFITPTAFRKNHRYIFFPDVRLIFQNIMLRFDACSEQSTVFDETLLRYYEENVRISKYRLKSTTFCVEGTRIPSFTGEITLQISGSQHQVNLAWMLFEFACWSGIGIKTSMGMGAIEILGKKKSKQK